MKTFLPRANAPEEQPACFIGESPKEATITWWAWSDMATRSDPGASSYCNDCQPWYQSEMIRLGLCAHPGTTFKQETADGSKYGPGDEERGLIGERPTHGKLIVDRYKFPVKHPDGKKRQRSNAKFESRFTAEQIEISSGAADVSLRLKGPDGKVPNYIGPYDILDSF